MYEVQDPQGVRHACKVVTKSSLKTKKAKTKVIFFYSFEKQANSTIHSSMQKSRFIVLYNIPTLYVSKNVLKTIQTYT